MYRDPIWRLRGCGGNIVYWRKIPAVWTRTGSLEERETHYNCKKLRVKNICGFTFTLVIDDDCVADLYFDRVWFFVHFLVYFTICLVPNTHI